MVLLWLIPVFGCKAQSNKQDVASSETMVVQIPISVGDTSRYIVGNLGDEDRASILVKPKHNLIEGFCSKNREPLIYCYSPRKAFAGSDTAIVNISTGSDGSNPPDVHSATILVYSIH